APLGPARPTLLWNCCSHSGRVRRDTASRTEMGPHPLESAPARSLRRRQPNTQQQSISALGPSRPEVTLTALHADPQRAWNLLNGEHQFLAVTSSERDAGAFVQVIAVEALARLEARQARLELRLL